MMFITPRNLRTGLKPLCMALAIGLMVTACDSDTQSDQSSAAENLSRAEAYSKQGQYRAALIEAQNALQQSPNNIEALAIFANIYNELGQHSQTISLLERYQEQSGEALSDSAKIELIDAYLHKGKINSAGKLIANTSAAANSTDAIELSLLKALNHALNRRAEEAYQELNSILQASPNHPQALTEQARLLLAQGQLEAATEKAKEALASQQNFAPALSLLATIAYQQDDLEQAEDYLSDALISLPKTDIITPERASVLKRLTDILSRQGRSNEALIYAKLLSEASPEQQVIEEKMQAAIEAYQNGELDKAKALLEEVHPKLSNKETSGFLLGSINLQQGDLEQATEYLEAAVDPEIASDKAISVLALAQIRNGEFSKAIDLLETEIQTGNSQELPGKLHALLGIAQLSNQQTEQAVSNLKKAIALQPELAPPHLALGRYYLATGKVDKAEAQLEQALTATNYNTKVVKAAVALKLRNNKPKQALAIADSYIKTAPNSSIGHTVKGRILASQQQIPEAMKSAKQALKLTASDADALLLMAQLHMINKDWAEANQSFNRLAETSPGNAFAYRGLLQSKIQLQQADAGLAQLQALFEQSNDHRYSALVLAEYHLSQQQIDNAESWMQKAQQSNSDDKTIQSYAVQFYTRLSQYHLSQGNNNKVRQALIAGLSAAPNNLQLLTLLAENEARSDQAMEARKILARINELTDNEQAIDVIHGKVLLQLKDFSTAEQHLQKAWDRKPSDALGNQLLTAKRQNKTPGVMLFVDQWLEAIPQSANARLQKALLLQSSGNMSKAQYWYEQSLELQPKQPLALNNLAWIYSENGDKRAIELAKKAHESAPQSGAIADTYGWILVQQGEIKAGIEILEKAVALSPDNAEISEHLKQAKAKL